MPSIPAGMRSAALSALGIAALVLAACGGGAAEDTASRPPAPQPPPAAAPPRTVSVYFLRDGKLGASRRSVASTPRIGTAALEELLAGPTADERAAGLSTAIPS